ncbi:ATP phosphoribosyltransferase [Halarchaeum acidiphilum MH1-52-1]|uniref:ATP phosphoribosyltransferase n=1 Tax=Halarchaeum acidiphilum MH1-52-1 TaxID=1261545 RepID=U3A3N5_9EURY|nr:ATP phosphoribosyltransferase [Halarchaeum acidiphilum]GAD52259.1 ATP phosphoribosyltransferase [Halarchaeum acidiphilum MH1-52-1]
MKIAVPNKGRLHDPTLDLLDRAGLAVEAGSDRQLYADTVDPDVSVLFARAADIPEYVADGAADLGITGYDQHRESRVENVSDLLDLEYGSCRLVLAAPEDGEIETPDDLDGRTVATEFPTVTAGYFDGREIDVDVVEVTGATELTPHVEMADAIVDITSTGTTLRMNHLAVVDEVLDSSVRLFARDDVAETRDVERVATALRSVLDASGKRYVMLNVDESDRPAVEEVLPGMGGPTVMDVEGEESVAVHAVVDERDVFATVAELKDVGARDVLVTEIERLVR